VVVGGTARGGEGLGGAVALGVRVAVDDDVAEEVEQLRGAVAAGLEGEELGRGVDQRGGGLAGAERGWAMTFSRNGMLVLTPRMRNSRRTRRARSHRDVVGLAAGDDLHQHRVVERRDDGAGVAHAAVEADAEAAGRAVGEDAAVVGMNLFSGSSVVMRHWMA
jgi:hypothetical protein